MIFAYEQITIFEYCVYITKTVPLHPKNGTIKIVHCNGKIVLDMMKKKSIKLLVALSMLQGLAGKAYATAFMVMGYEKAMEVLAKNPTITAYFVLEDPPPCPSHKGKSDVDNIGVCARGVITTIPTKKCIVIK